MDTFTIFTSGITQGEPGPATIDVRIEDASGRVLQEVTEAIGNAGKNLATYQAVMRGLQVAEEYFGDKTKDLQFSLKLDNEFVKKQINDEIQIKEPALVPYFIEIHNLRVTNFTDLKIILISENENK